MLNVNQANFIFKKNLRAHLLFIATIFIAVSSTNAQPKNPVKLSWLGVDAPSVSSGISWGVPLPEGVYQPANQFMLEDESNQKLPVQSWPMAYWPDGSLKWVGLSSIVDGNSGEMFQLSLANSNMIDDTKPLVTEKEDAFLVETGNLTCSIPKEGQKIIQSIVINDSQVTTGGQLVCIAQNGPANEFGPQPTKEKYIGQLENVTLEQNGPVRSVIKIEGQHVGASGDRKWLPFTLRLYFYKDQASVRMVHTIIYDGGQEKDFIRGLGIFFDVPLDEAMYNRHVRFSGDQYRLWDEPVQPLKGRYPFSWSDGEIYDRQLRGERLLSREEYPESSQFLIDHLASWNDFKLEQINADGFQVRKRTNEQSAWIDAGAGNRSGGLAFVGDVSGGLAICLRDFWQSFPSALEIRNARTDQAQLRAWLWSPDAEAMDMRHYDTLEWGHNLRASYEDVQPGFSLATGVGRTSEITLFASEDVPTYETLSAFAKQVNEPPLLTVTPEYIHQIPVFGQWSLPDRSSAGKEWIENQLDNALEYYQLEIEQRHWYGFWDYGDVMHAYDHDRHVWMYDVGGYAWDNTELMPNMWLWYSYLRSGRKDIFRMAEAMTRHNGEVDVYHLGRFEGLGSRHNVRHWGDGAKEVRISQAALGRFYYYLTTDERTGDLMEASVEASNQAIGKIDPLRLILKENKYPTHARFGPDWMALVGNWMTAWERTGDDKFRERIMVGVNSLSKMPYGVYSGVGAAMGYDPSTYKLYQLEKDDIGFSHLSVLMGGPEIGYELTHLLDNKKWDKLWMQYCRLYAAPKEEIEAEFGVDVKLGDKSPWYARLPAYYAMRTNNQKYATRAWDMFLNVGSQRGLTNFNMEAFEGIQSLGSVYEVRGVSTNNTAQWCLNAIELLEMVGDQIPENSERFQEGE